MEGAAESFPREKARTTETAAQLPPCSGLPETAKLQFQFSLPGWGLLSSSADSFWSMLGLDPRLLLPPGDFRYLSSSSNFAYGETRHLLLIQKTVCRLVRVNVDSPTAWALS